MDNNNFREAADLLQTTSATTIPAKEKQLRADVTLRSRLYTVVRSVFIRNYRKIVSEETFADRTESCYSLTLPPDSGFASAEGAYDLKEMHRILSTLPSDERIPFSMHLSGFTYREISERLGIPLGTIKSRIFFTRQKLLAILRDFR